MRGGTYCARLATIIGSLAVTEQLIQSLHWATAVDLPPIEPLDDALLPFSTPASPTVATDSAPSSPSTSSFVESLGPTDLVSSPVPNEGDTQLLHALNAAIYQSVYAGTEEARRERWRRIWRRYYDSPGLDADIILESLPPAHLCPPPIAFPSYPKRSEAVGSFEENVLQLQNFVYIAQFSMPPFLFFSRKKPQGLVDIQDLDYLPGQKSHGYGILKDLLHSRVIPALKKQYRLPKLRVSWSYRPPSCDVRLAADSLYADMAIMQMGLVSPTPYVKRYLSTTCPLLMYGKLTLLSGYGHKVENRIEAWNSPRVLIGTLTFVPWKHPVAEQLAEARIKEYSSFAQLLAAAWHRRVDGLLLPAATASVLQSTFGNIFGRHGLPHFSEAQVVGHIGQNNIPVVYTVRKYPMEPPYVNTFFDDAYDSSEIKCQDIL